jgi:succinyl-diaminopimelate desuccinylase
MSELAPNAAPIDPVALAAELIRRPSVTPKDEGALSIVAASLEQLGFICYPLTFAEEGPNGEKTEPVSNLYARCGSGRPNLCFAGHTDVVPTGAVDAWSFEPFAATVKDGALCGRGAVDMKGAIAAFIAAAEHFLATRGAGFTGSISLLITGDEEGIAVNGTKKVLEWLRERGEALDACLVGEPTSAAALGDMIKIGRRGSMTGRLTAPTTPRTVWCSFCTRLRRSRSIPALSTSSPRGFRSPRSTSATRPQMSFQAVLAPLSTFASTICGAATS